MQPVQPVTLSDDRLRLEPLSMQHVDGLKKAAADGELWNLRFTSVPEPHATAAYVEAALKHQAEGHRLPFAVIEVESGEVIGCTSYHDIVPAHELGIPTIWIPHSYPGCSQHAPNEHLPAPLAREALRLMAGLYWDLGEGGTPPGR